MKLVNFFKVNQNNFINIFTILLVGLFLRLYYLFKKTGNIFQANLGGDSCYHYNVALNIYQNLVLYLRKKSLQVMLGKKQLRLLI